MVETSGQHSILPVTTAINAYTLGIQIQSLDATAGYANTEVSMSKLDDKVFQEFYCGECENYIRMRLNMEWDRIVEVTCPMCGHMHKRCITKGVITENGRAAGSAVEQICPPKSACSKEPITKHMAKAKAYGERRDGAVVKSPEDLQRDAIMKERWVESYGE